MSRQGDLAAMVDQGIPLSKGLPGTKWRRTLLSWLLNLLRRHLLPRWPL
jgi:hypothetical protein